MSIFEKPTTFVFEKYTCTERIFYIFQFYCQNTCFQQYFRSVANLTCRYKFCIIVNTFIIRDFIFHTQLYYILI